MIFFDPDVAADKSQGFSTELAFCILLKFVRLIEEDQKTQSKHQIRPNRLSISGRHGWASLGNPAGVDLKSGLLLNLC